jgi:uncharacterized protein YbcV (DUF1398 family)
MPKDSFNIFLKEIKENKRNNGSEKNMNWASQEIIGLEHNKSRVHIKVI